MRWLLALAGLAPLAACGDDRARIEVFEPTSGTRLAIEQYQFDDGTRTVQPTAFYDRRIHARCTPKTWFDGVLRCVPDAEQAVYTDAACETLVGVGRTIEFPTHFLTYDTKDGVSLPERIFAAGDDIAPIETYYLRSGQGADQTCSGPYPFSPDEERTFWELTGELDGTALVPITEDEVGDGRLALVVRRGDDGTQVPLGFRDRDLDVACSPAPRGDTGVCEPIGLGDATWFADSACTRFALPLPADVAPPALATTRDARGCREVRRSSAPQTTPLYRRSGTACLAAGSFRAAVLGEPVALAPVERTPDARPERRVQPILASDGALHVYADRLFDSATRAECQLTASGDELRCLPTTLAPVLALYANAACTIPLLATVVAEPACEPVAFAALATGEALEVHAIGDPVPAAYQLSDFGCAPYPLADGEELRALGPTLPADAFVGAVAFGAR